MFTELLLGTDGVVNSQISLQTMEYRSSMHAVNLGTLLSSRTGTPDGRPCSVLLARKFCQPIDIK